MPAPFPHQCSITEPNPVDPRPIDSESGQPVGAPPAPVAVYAGRCFFDASVQRVRREMGGDVDLAGKAVLTLPKVAALFDQDTSAVSVTANGYQYSGLTIAKVSYNRRRTVLVVDLNTRPTLA